MKLIPIENWSEIDPKHAAISCCSKSTAPFKLGAVICDKKGRVVAWGYNNSKKTHPAFGSGKYKFLHAESAAIYCSVRLGVDVKGMTLMVFREGSNLAKPCAGCQLLLKKYGIAKVYYSVKT